MIVHAERGAWVFHSQMSTLGGRRSRTHKTPRVLYIVVETVGGNDPSIGPSYNKAWKRTLTR